MSTTDDLLAFLRVVETGSFTRAALGLDVPKASVSNAVKRLEARVGTQLLRRTTRRVEVTADGTAFAERARDVLADMDELLTQFQAAGESLRGRLRVDMPMGVANEVVMPALPAFLARHPELELELSSTDRRVDVVREGFDCVMRIAPLADSSLVARPLGWYPQASVASPDYLQRHGVPATLDDLAHHRLIHYSATLGQRPAGFEVVDESAPGGVRVVPMAGTLTVNNSEAYSAACHAGLGIIQVPRIRADAEIARGTLVEVLPGHRVPPLPVHLLYAQRRHLPRRVQVFMDWLQALMQPHLQDWPRA